MKNIYRIRAISIVFCALLIFCASDIRAQAVIDTFAYTGSMQTFTVPACVSTITVDARGAQGANALDKLTTNSSGGLGGRSVAVLTVTTGQVINIFVGGVGNTNGNGGYNGGGSGGSSSAGSSCSGGPAGGGGGASDIRAGGIALTNRVIVAGGGGGAGRDYCNGTCQPCGCGGSGGSGGGLQGLSGQAANNCGYGSAGNGTNGGAGGTATSGGAGGPGNNGGNSGTAGATGVGGTGGAGTYDVAGGGGGGGYYGGGGGGAASSGSGVGAGGGGGGSSFVSGLGVSGGVTTATFQTGNGMVILKYDYFGAITGASATPSVLCSGSSATLSGNGQLSYTWTPVSSNSSSIVVSPTINTSYTVSGTNSVGCVSSAVINLTVDPALPSLTVANTATNSSGICPGNTVALTASGATTYSWTGGVQNGIAFSPASASGYTVTGANACGTSSAATSVSVHPQPTITLSQSTMSLCTTQSVSLCPSGGVSYTMYPPGTQSCAAVYPFSTTTYSVRGTSALGCTNTAMATVTVVTTPAVPPASTHSLVCIGSSATLSAVGASNYSWMPGNFSTSSIVVTPNATSTYTLTKWNANCIDVQTITVIVNQLPVLFAIANPTIVCATTPATLSGGGGTSYSWSPNVPQSGPNAAVVVVYPPASTIYTLTATDGTCVNTTTVELLTNPLPVISLAPSTPSLCSGQTVSFTISGADTYVYTNNPTTAPPITGTTAALTLTSTTSYAVAGTNTTTGCSSSTTQVIVVHDLPAISIARSPTLVCEGGASTLTASSTFQRPAHIYSWTHGGTGTLSTVNPQNTSTYTVTGTNTITGCVNTQTVSVAVFHPTFTTTPDTAICLKGSINLVASGAAQYVWNPGNISGVPFINVSPSVTTIYTVSAISSTVNGLKCPSEQTIQVGIYNNPTITATAQRTTVCRNEKVDLYATGANTYTWITANNQQGGTITVSPIKETTYWVIGTDIYGCKDTTNVLVKFSNCPGFDEHTRLNVSIFPNPSSGAFSIKAASDMRLELVNELGQLVRIISLTKANSHTVHLEGLAAGVYFLNGRQEDVMLSEKIIIQR